MSDLIDQENCSKIWHVLEPYIQASSQIIKTGSTITPYKCLGSDEAISYYYKLFTAGPGSIKPFWMSKRRYVAAVRLLVPEYYAGMARGVELKYVSRTGCHYWYGDGTLKNHSWEEETAFHQKVVKLTGIDHENLTFVVQVDITSVYDRLKGFLAPI
jgi:hypothetical protein